MKAAILGVLALCAIAAAVVVVAMRTEQAEGSERSGHEILADMKERRAAAPVRSTAVPTPTPQPGAFADCYGARRPDSDTFTLLAADAGSLFANCQVIAYYGYPGTPGLGTLGQGEPARMVERLRTETAAHDAANGSRRAIPALEIIVAVAQETPQDDGSSLYRMPADLIESQIAFARANDLLVILDVQMGHSTVDAELQRLLPYLADSRVHLALDPEWAMQTGVRPGAVIGGMDASAINRAQEILANLVREERLPGSKVLVVHQFDEGMIRNRDQLRTFPGVDLVIDMDGFGGREAKLANYRHFVADAGAAHGGLKLFYQDDVDLLLPANVGSLSPQPDLVIYQ